MLEEVETAMQIFLMEEAELRVESVQDEAKDCSHCERLACSRL